MAVAGRIMIERAERVAVGEDKNTIYTPSLTKSLATSFRLNTFSLLPLIEYGFNIPASVHRSTVSRLVPTSQATLSSVKVVIFRLLSTISHCLQSFLLHLNCSLLYLQYNHPKE